MKNIIKRKNGIIELKKCDRPTFADASFAAEFSSISDSNNVNYYQLSKKFSPEKDTAYFYKYMDLESALLSLRNGNLRFVEPTRWEDKYEGRFYNANYHNVSKNICDYPFLFSCCMTVKPHNEAAWKVYSYGKIGLGAHCVQFKINRNQFRKELISSKKTENSDIYEGLVTYIGEEIISNIHEKTYKDYKGRVHPNENYQSFFSRFDRISYLNLLLLKRDYFRHENEVRFFIVPSNATGIKGKLSRKNGKEIYGSYSDVNIDWSNVIEEIRIDSNCTDLEYELFKDECLKLLHSSNRYKKCGIRYRNNLDKKFKPIKTNIYGKRHKVTVE